MFQQIFGALSSAYGSNRQRQQANAQMKEVRASFDDTIKREGESYNRLVGQVATANRQKMGARALEATNMAGRLSAVLSNTGVTGQTQALLRNQISMDMGIDQKTLMENTANALEQARFEFDARINGYKNNAISGINGQAGKVDSGVGTLLSGFGSALDPTSVAKGQQGLDMAKNAFESVRSGSIFNFLK